MLTNFLYVHVYAFVYTVMYISMYYVLCVQLMGMLEQDRQAIINKLTYAHICAYDLLCVKVIH